VAESNLKYGEILGEGNGGLVRAGVLKVSGIPVAIKVGGLLVDVVDHQLV
jgi:hypothetical protein